MSLKSYIYNKKRGKFKKKNKLVTLNFQTSQRNAHFIVLQTVSLFKSKEIIYSAELQTNAAKRIVTLQGCQVKVCAITVNQGLCFFAACGK